MELEHIKTSDRKSDEIKFRARKAVHFLDENPNLYQIVYYGNDAKSTLESLGLEETPDNKICACCKSYSEMSSIPVIFISDDLCCKLTAKDIFGLEVSGLNHVSQIYKGYKVIEGDTGHINSTMSTMDLSDWSINEYLIIKNTDDGSEREMRFNGESFVSLRLPPSKYIKAKNSLQRCALDLLANPDITVAAVLGGYGSGKTFLSMKMALYHVTEKGNQSKILGVREPRGEGKEVGFLPGDLNSKTDNFFLPLAQQLDGGTYELESLMQRGILESNIPYYLKGTTYNDTIILVDEAEDLNDKQIRLIGTRIGENSKIYLAGDYKQSVINASENNALVKMCNAFRGLPNFGCIYLGTDVRSSTSRMFAELV